MNTRQTLIVALLLTAAALGYSLLLFPSLPDRIPIHWNINGEVDGWGGKTFGTFLMPGTMGVFLGLLFVLPWLSPRNFTVDTFRETFNYVMVVVIALMGYMHVIMLYSGLHPRLDVSQALVGGLMLFFALIGNVLGKVKRNFWMGVRTPWTLASETVWIATHRFAARLFVGGGLLGALAAWLGVPLSACFVLLMVVAFAPAIHSLILYKRLEREGRLQS